MDIATWLARGRSIALGGAVEGAGLVVGMERLYEAFVEKSLSSAIATLSSRSLTVKAQDSKVFAVPEGSTGRPYYTRPDNVIYEGNTPVLLVDAKYKTFVDADAVTAKSRPTNADLYQMASSLVAHGCTKGLLVYPMAAWESPSVIRWWSVALPGAAPLKIGAGILPLARESGSVGFERVDKDLANTVTAALAK